jgi:hypothetical protein
MLAIRQIAAFQAEKPIVPMPASRPQVFSAVKGGKAAAPRSRPLTALNT